jgi:hypothetical protein
VIPDARQSLFPNSTFADAKPCSAWTPVHGFMGHYEGSDLPAQDVWDATPAGQQHGVVRAPAQHHGALDLRISLLNFIGRER